MSREEVMRLEVTRVEYWWAMEQRIVGEASEALIKISDL
jgi:hypothetical protein